MGRLLVSRQADSPWLPNTATYANATLAAWWDAVDTSTVSTSGGLVTSWASKVGSRPATPASTGPAWSTTARNSLPGVVFTGSTAERLTFSATGLPSSTSASTIVVVGYATSNANSKSAAGYGSGSANYDTRAIRAVSQKVCVSINGSNPTSEMSWDGNDRIVISEFLSSGVTTQNVDGGSNLPSFPYVSTLVTTTSKGRIGVFTTDTSPWDGVIQCVMIFSGTLTTLEKDLLSGYLADRYGLTGGLPANHPYKNVAPLSRSTLSSDMLRDYSVIWSDNFASLSLRTGGRYINTTSGYNDPTSKGTWASAGLNYMTDSKGGYGFGFDWFVNHAYNWQALDATFPPLGMYDITDDGLVLKSTSDYPLVRAALPLTSGSHAPHLSSMLCTTQTVRGRIPFARRTTFTLSSNGDEDFPAIWSLGERYNGNSNFTKHQEWDDFERFGNDYVSGISSQHIHVFLDDDGDTGNANSDEGGGVNFNIGVAIAGGAQAEVMALLNDDGYTYFYTNGVLTDKRAYPSTPYASTDEDDGFDIILNMSVNPAWHSYVDPIANASMTIRKVEILAPPSNTICTFPPAPPVPVLTWGGSFTGGAIPVGTSNGTVVATLSGASSYTLLDYNGSTPSHLAISGSNVVTSGSLSSGTFNFYIRGLDADGVPGIAPKKTATIS